MSEPVSNTAQIADERGTSDGKSHAKVRLQSVVVNDSGHDHVEEVAQIDRDEMAIETLGLTLAEGRLILKRIQETGSSSRMLCFDGATARNAVRHATAKGITTSRFALCLGTSS